METSCLARNKSPWVRRFFPPPENRITNANIAVAKQITSERETPAAASMPPAEVPK